MSAELERVFCTLESTEKFSAIDEVINRCTIFDELKDKAKFIDKVHKREKIQSTGIGHGVAIAHGKLSDLDHCMIALGYSEEGIVFDDNYPDPVHLLFVIASSVHRQAEYLHSVSSILSWVHNDEFRKDIECGVISEDIKTFIELLKKQEFIPLRIE